jgi:hypothetical protein
MPQRGTAVALRRRIMFVLVGTIRNAQIIATGQGIRQLKHLRMQYGGWHWRKVKGDATVLLETGAVRWAEIHWYEAHGAGKKDLKIKRFLD